MLYDTHIHTRMSADSTMDPEDAIQKAGELGLGIIFTEHIDYDFPSTEYNFVTNIEEYLIGYHRYKNDRVLTGLEIGMTNESLDRNTRLAADTRLDYVLGTVHIVNGMDICTDFYQQELNERDAYIKYLQFVLEMVEKNDFFDCLGHIDYPSRYSRFKNTIIDYNTYEEYYNAILECLISKNKCIEINTVLLNTYTALDNLVLIYKSYYRLGGRTVTIGSDSHNPYGIGNNFDIAMMICSEIGLEPVYFSQRKMYSCV